MREIVGNIGSYDVIYIPEKDCCFCKNTVVPFALIQSIIKGDCCRGQIPEKNLTITKNNGIVCLGCLTTTMENMLQIEKNIKNYKKCQKSTKAARPQLSRDK